jgi:hypothetical protein
MAEDTASGGTTDQEAAEPGHATPEGESSAPAPAQPVNKLHEWAAAIAIMIVLATIVGWFIWFLRGWSM